MTADRQDSRPTRPAALEDYIAQVKADAQAGTLEPHEWLIMHAPGDRRQVMMLTAAVYLCQGFTPDDLDDDEDGGWDDRMIGAVMRYVQRERPAYVAEIGRILGALKARWPRKLTPEEENIARLMAADFIAHGRTAAWVRENAAHYPEVTHYLIRAADIMEQPVSPGLDPDISGG